MKLITMICAFFATHTIIAQQASVQENVHLGAGLVGTKKTESHKAEGSQYFNDSFIPAKKNESDTDILIRYNAFNDQIEINENNNTISLTPQRDIEITTIDRKNTYVYTEFVSKNGDILNGYLSIISKNNLFTLYKRERIIYEPEVHQTSSYDQYKPPRYKKLDNEYFFKMNNQVILAFPKKKKDLEKVFSGKEKELNLFIKENKISLSDEFDLIKLSNYLNTLLK
jgi:hypothetical protein